MWNKFKTWIPVILLIVSFVSSVCIGIFESIKYENYEATEAVVSDISDDFVKIKTVDFSEEYQEKPNADELRAISISYIESNNIGVPSVSLSVSFAQLERIEEYKGQRLLEDVNLFDTVNVEFPALGVSENAKAVKVVYDALADRVKSIDLGSGRANISDTIASLGEIKKVYRIPKQIE